MSVKDFLLKLARKVVQEVVDELNRQLTQIQQNARQPIETFIRTVVNGAWVGPDADKFVNEMTGLFTPNIEKTATVITSISNGINSAIDIIDNADRTAADMVSDLESQFSRIY